MVNHSNAFKWITFQALRKISLDRRAFQEILASDDQINPHLFLIVYASEVVGGKVLPPPKNEVLGRSLRTSEPDCSFVGNEDLLPVPTVSVVVMTTGALKNVLPRAATDVLRE